MKEHIVCPIKSCKMSGQCVRYKRFQEAEEDAESYETLNPKKLKPDEQGCEHRLVSQQWRMAYGFCNLYQTLPVSAASRFYTELPFSSETKYYRYKRGAYPIEPLLQEQLLEIFRKKGGDPSVGFDRYQYQEVLVKPSDNPLPYQ